MPQNNVSAPSRTYDRTAPRGTQFTPVCNDVQQFMDSTRKSVSLPVTFNHFGIMDFTSNPEQGDDRTAWTPTKFITYTRAELTKHFTAMIFTCMDHCSAAFNTHIPNRSKYSANDIAAALTWTYTVSKGANKDVVRNHLAHFQAAARNTINRNMKVEAVVEAVENGDAWMAEGVVDKDGNPIAYISEAKAKKAHARKAHTDLVEATKDGPANKRVTGEWWQPKTRKTAYMDAAIVASYMTELAVSMDTLRTMPAIRVRQLAKKAGAPDKVTTGKGATDRCIEWFSVDVARITLANR